MSRANVGLIVFASAVALACIAFVVAGLARLPDVAMSGHGWFALILGIVFSVILGAILATVLIIGRRRGFDEAAHEMYRRQVPGGDPEN
ncbi:hypothetical protein [Maricaulis sp. CAU 1757]